MINVTRTRQFDDATARDGWVGLLVRRNVSGSGDCRAERGIDRSADPVATQIMGLYDGYNCWFCALLALPWSLKPLYGLLTDFVPIARTRRRSYLMLTSGISALALLVLYLIPIPAGSYQLLLYLLLVPTVGVAFSDVVVDALMIEKGQPRGLTGTLQSVQWAAMYFGTIVAGLVGGYLSQNHRQNEGFLICGMMAFMTFLLTWLYVKEKPFVSRKGHLRLAATELSRAVKTPAVVAAAAFLFLWSFNPFSMSVLYVHMTNELGISEQNYGVTISMLSIGAIIGSLGYSAYCRRVRMSWLVHLSIVMGVLSTLAYCLVVDQKSAAIVSLLVGFTYLTGSMVQYDLAARACPTAAAGTTFALLMALSNLSMSLSSALRRIAVRCVGRTLGSDHRIQSAGCRRRFVNVCLLVDRAVFAPVDSERTLRPKSTVRRRPRTDSFSLNPKKALQDLQPARFGHFLEECLIDRFAQRALLG